MARSPAVTHKIMSAIHSRDTTPEILLRKELWRRGLRYRKNYKKLPGKPDIVFVTAKLAVFCDGDFWHGHNWAIRGYGSLESELERYSEEWANKIRRNTRRDAEVDRQLKDMGWDVLRFWESDIKKDVHACGDRVWREYKLRMEARRPAHCDGERREGARENWQGAKERGSQGKAVGDRKDRKDRKDRED